MEGWKVEGDNYCLGEGDSEKGQMDPMISSNVFYGSFSKYLESVTTPLGKKRMPPPPSIEHNCAFHLPTFSVNVELELHQNFGRHHFAKKVSKKIWS